MIHTPISAWIFTLMVTLLPVEKGAAVPTPKDNRETVEEREDRYHGIAKAIEEVVFDDNEEPLFKGEDGRRKTAALLVAVTYFESGGWNKVVDFGIGPRGRGDGGTSHCLAQVRLSPGMSTRHGYSAEDLTFDRAKCFRAALAIARDSFRSCGPNVPLDRKLAVYASGRCDAGLKESATRMKTAQRIFKTVPLPSYGDDETRADLLP